MSDGMRDASGGRMFGAQKGHGDVRPTSTKEMARIRIEYGARHDGLRNLSKEECAALLEDLKAIRDEEKPCASTEAGERERLVQDLIRNCPIRKRGRSCGRCITCRAANLLRTEPGGEPAFLYHTCPECEETHFWKGARPLAAVECCDGYITDWTPLYRLYT